MNAFLFEKNSKKTTIIVIIICIILLIVSCCILIFPYIKAEYFTLKYGEQFKNSYSMTNMIDGVEFYKVIEYDGKNAKVYYVESGGLTTHYVYFIRDSENDKWKMKTWETIWSKYGSASDAAWPYYFKECIQ